MSYKKQSQKKQGKQMSMGLQIACIVLALVLIAAAVLTILQFCTPYKPSEWFGEKNPSGSLIDKDKNPDDTPGTNDSDETNGGLVETDRVEASGMKINSTEIPQAMFTLYGISEQAESARELEVVFDPANATDQRFTVQAHFKGEKTWSSGKTVTDYLTVEQSASESSKIIVTNLAPFGDPISVTVQSVSNPAAEVVIDYGYCSRLEGFHNASYIRGKNEIKMINLGADTQYHLQLNWGVGTENGTVRVDSVYVRFAEEYFWGPVQNTDTYKNAGNVDGFSGGSIRTNMTANSGKGISVPVTPSTSGGIISLDGTFCLNVYTFNYNTDGAGSLFTISGGGNTAPVVQNLTKAVYETNLPWKAAGTSGERWIGTVTFNVTHISMKEGETEANAWLKETKSITLPVYYLNLDTVVVNVDNVNIAGNPDTIF